MSGQGPRRDRVTCGILARRFFGEADENAIFTHSNTFQRSRPTWDRRLSGKVLASSSPGLARRVAFISTRRDSYGGRGE
jgi:hypothetical protein